MSGRFVLVGLARTRRPWFSEVARWSTSGAAPVEFLKCLTAEEVRAVLGAGRRVSALLVDGTAPGVDRDLVATAAQVGTATVVVTDGRVRRDWDSMGCAAVLPGNFGADDLRAVLERHARPVEPTLRTDSRADFTEPVRSQLISVCGPGGTGASTVAMAVAQSLSIGRPPGTTALVDGARVADLAMYHDVDDVIPGLPELVEMHRVDHPDPDDIRGLLFRIEDRGYDLLLGLRTPRDWVAMRPHSLAAAVGGLERSYDLLVVDHDPDLEGEEDTGSVGIEDRHAIARTVLARADLAVLVGRPGMKGVADLVRLASAVADLGTPAERIVPVVNRCPRSPRPRSEICRAFQSLTHDTARAQGTGSIAPPIFLGPHRGIDAAHRSSTSLPEGWVRPLAGTVRRLLLELGNRRRPAGLDGAPIRPGELGIGIAHGITALRSDVA